MMGVHNLPAPSDRRGMMIKIVNLCSIMLLFWLSNDVVAQGDIHLETSNSKQIIPGLLESASKAWLNKLDFTGDFELEFALQGPEGRYHGICKGRISYCQKAIRVTANWQPNTNGIQFFPSFEFGSKNGIDIYQLLPSRVAKRKGFQFDLTEVSILATRPRLSISNTTLIHSRHPINLLPNSIGFVGGWNQGVVFGGLDLSPRTARKHQKAFDQYGYTDLEAETSIQLAKRDQEAIQVVVRDNLVGMPIERIVDFELLSGTPLKRSEQYRSFNRDGTLRTTKQVKVTEFLLLEGYPIPQRMTSKLNYKSCSTLYDFRFLEHSMRKSESTDFNFDLGENAELLMPESADGMFNVLQDDISILEYKFRESSTRN